MKTSLNRIFLGMLAIDGFLGLTLTLLSLLVPAVPVFAASVPESLAAREERAMATLDIAREEECGDADGDGECDLQPNED